MKCILPLALALTALFAVPASADIVINGGFEDPGLQSHSYSYLHSIPGWTLASGPAIEVQNHVAGSPFAGRQFVELDSSANSSMYQDLSTVVGRTYELSFAYSARPGVAANSTGIDVSWAGSSVASLALSGIGFHDTSWHVYTYDIKADSTTTRLQFSATGISDSYGGYLDAVKVSAVPEPSVMALSSIAGLTALGAAIRRRWAKRRRQV